MDNQTMLTDAFISTKACEAMIKALKKTVLVSADLANAYNENLKDELKRLSEQYPELAVVFERAIHHQ